MYAGVPLVVGSVRLVTVTTQVHRLLQTNVSASVVLVNGVVIVDVLSQKSGRGGVHVGVTGALGWLGTSITLLERVGRIIVNAVAAAFKGPSHDFVLVAVGQVDNGDFHIGVVDGAGGRDVVSVGTWHDGEPMELLHGHVVLIEVQAARGCVSCGLTDSELCGGLNKRCVLKALVSISDQISRFSSSSVNGPILVHVRRLLDQTLLKRSVRRESLNSRDSVTGFLNVVVAVGQEGTSGR